MLLANTVAPQAGTTVKDEGGAPPPAAAFCGKSLIEPEQNGPGSVKAMDLDGDGDLDAVVTGGQFNYVQWHENASGDGSTWSYHVLVPFLEFATDARGSDVDGDGDLDVLAVGRIANRAMWAENPGSPPVVPFGWPQHTVSDTVPSPEEIAGADVDGDGDVDAVLASTSVGALWVENLLSDGTSWKGRTVESTETAASPIVFPRNMRVADIDLDGDEDVYVCYTGALGDPAVAWHENVAGDGSAWSMHVVITSEGSYNARDVAAADMDGDGDTDFLSTSGVVDVIEWHENVSGDGETWTRHDVDGAAVNAEGVDAADVDGDGWVDVFATMGTINGDVVWSRNLASPALEIPRDGAPANPAAFLPGQTSAPVTGSTWDPVVDHSTFFTDAFVDLVAISGAPANAHVPPYGTLLVGPVAFTAVSSPGVPFSIPIPNDCSLIGAKLYTQAGSSSSNGSVALLTNALDITLGTY